ncbi:LysR substrate-binding domain-containing protein [Serratia ureilytica]
MRRASQLLDEHSDLLDMSGTYKRSLNGMVTLGAPIGIHAFLARYLLPPLLHAAPALTVDLVTRNPDEREKVRRSVRQRLRFADQLFQPQNESLIARPFTRFRVGLFAAPDYIARSPLTALDELPQHRCITLRMLGGIRTPSGYNAQGSWCRSRSTAPAFAITFCRRSSWPNRAWHRLRPVLFRRRRAGCRHTAALPGARARHRYAGLPDLPPARRVAAPRAGDDGQHHGER